MIIKESPKETVISLAQENRALRWVSIALSLAVAAMAAALWARRPAPVWLVKEDGVIFRGDKRVFSWEPIEASRRGVEYFFVRSDGREKALPRYFTGAPLAAAKEYQATDRLISFRAVEVREEPDSTVVQASIMREGQPTLQMSLELSRVERTEENPFGLVISSATIHK